MTDSSFVLQDRPEPNVLRLTLNRADKRNALNPELREELFASLQFAASDADTRAIIIAAAGGHFCAGGDLQSLSGVDAVSGRKRIQRGHALVRTIVNADKAVVAAVEGYAMGAGAGLAMACDTVVTDANATFGFPFLKVGLGPDFGVSYTLPRRIGQAAAQHAFLHAKNFGGEEAARIGIADELAEPGSVNEKALTLATALAELPPNGIALSKRQFAAAPQDFEAAAEMEAMGQAICFEGSEFAEGVAAFKEKRRPRF